jgi:hypothetical protein
VGLYVVQHTFLSNVRKCTAAPVLLLLSALGCTALPGSALAAQQRAQLGVSAVVLPMATLQVNSAPADLQITINDLRRGFVDVVQPTSIVVNSNSAEGIALDLMTLNEMLSLIVVDGVDSAQVLGAEGGTLVRRWQRPQSLRLNLKFRLLLAPGLTAGRYPWPLRLGVRPL